MSSSSNYYLFPNRDMYKLLIETPIEKQIKISNDITFLKYKRCVTLYDSFKIKKIRKMKFFEFF